MTPVPFDPSGASSLRKPSTAKQLSRRQSLVIVAIGMAMSLAIGLLALFGLQPTTRLDHAALDTLVAYAASGEPARQTVVIDIDDVSLAAVGQWPWPRYRLAELIERIAAAGPAAIALDVLLPEEDRSSLTSLKNTFKRDFGVDLAFSGVPPGLHDNDGYLGSQIARTGAVAAHYFYFDHRNGDVPHLRSGITIGGRTDLLALPSATGVMVNAPAISSQSGVSGFVNQRSDDDGVLRRIPLLISQEGVIHPHLSLAAAMRAMNLTTVNVEEDDSGLALQLGDARVAIDRAGRATLRFNGRAALYASIPAVDLLSGRVRPDDLKGRIVFIGSTAVGLNDLHHTAVGLRFPGVKIQSAMAENILSSGAIRRPPWSPGAVFVWCLLAGALMSALFVVATGVYPFVVGSGLICAGSFLLTVVLYTQHGVFLSAGSPIFLTLSLFVTFSAARFAIERRRAQRWLKQLENARQVTIESMAAVAETRDPETGAHIKRTQNYVRAVAEALKRSGHYTEQLSSGFIELLFLSAPLHDIGKVGVPDHILLKPGRLTDDEMTEMKRHAEFGRRILLNTAGRIEGDNFLEVAADIAGSHHEKWDGSGYPLGLAGQAIPLAGRIMAVADIYDALISRRCYKEPFSHSLAMTIMGEARGQIFDPVVFDAFLSIEDQIKAIAERFKDEAEHTDGASPPRSPPTLPSGVPQPSVVAN